MLRSKSILSVAFSLMLAGMARGDLPVELPPIDQTLPYGSTAIPLPESPLLNATTPRTVELLAASLSRPETVADRRAELVEDLSRTKLPAALPALVKAAGDGDPTVRAAVAKGFAAFTGEASAVDTLAKLVIDSDPRVRAAAVVSAGALGRGDLVTAGINDADRSVVLAALSVAGADQAAAIVPKISSDDETIRLSSLEAVTRAGIAALADAVAARVNDPIPLRVAALRALGAAKATGHSDAVLAALSDKHPSIRRAATTALPNVLSKPDAQRRAIGMLADNDETVRTAAADVLAMTPGAETVAPLVKLLADPYTPLHTAIRAALVAGRDAAVPACVKLLDDSDPRRREDGSYVLGVLKTNEGFERHVKLLEDSDWGVVAQAAKSMGQIGNKSAGAPLVSMITRSLKAVEKASDNSVNIAMANAFVAAGQLSYAPVGPIAVSIIPNKRGTAAYARGPAMWALGIVGAPGDDRIYNSVPGFIADIEENPEVKLEGVKAIGNRKYRGGMATLDTAETTLPSPQILALAHWSRDRVNGNVTPFALKPVSWVVSTSIVDRSELGR